MKSCKDKQFDLACVDPDYGLGDKLTIGGTWSAKYKNNEGRLGGKPKKEYFDELFRVSKNWIIWGGNYFTEFIPSARCFICWVKPEMLGMHSMADCELALTSFDQNAKIANVTKGGENRIHITQKPISLYKWIFTRYANEGDKIFDSNLGSQSSRIAAYDLGIDFYGTEISKTHFENGNERFQNHIKQQSLFTFSEQVEPKDEIIQKTLF
jgi:site-specific DNA-methyltransferase (adenine-specific)